MALSEDNGMNTTMLVQPSGGFNYGGNMGGFGFGGDWAWILLLLVLGGGWGGGFGGFGMGAGMLGAGMMGGWELYPWLSNSEHISDGFRDAQLSDNVTSVRDGISALSTQVCNGFGDVQLGMCNGFNSVNNSIFGAQSALTQQLCNNEIASLNRSFAEQTANVQGFNNVQAQLAQCCCDNRAATADLKYTVATENCADRAAVNDGVRNIMENCNRNNQAILDKLCSLELNAKQEKINDLERQLSMATLAASQTAQTARLIADNTEQTQYIVNRVAPYPIPSYTVPNPFAPAAL